MKVKSPEISFRIQSKITGEKRTARRLFKSSVDHPKRDVYLIQESGHVVFQRSITHRYDVPTVKEFA